MKKSLLRTIKSTDGAQNLPGTAHEECNRTVCPNEKEKKATKKPKYARFFRTLSFLSAKIEIEFSRELVAGCCWPKETKRGEKNYRKDVRFFSVTCLIAMDVDDANIE